MASLQFITSNPVTDAYNAAQKRAADQESADLQNAVTRQAYDQNRQLFPSRLRSVTSAADLGDINLDIARQTKGDKIAQEGLDTRTKQQTVDFNAENNPLLIRSHAADADRSESQARVQGATEGAQISTANSNAATAALNTTEAAAKVQVAQNAAQYDKEGRWFELFSKNPQAAIAVAGQYGVPAELVAAAQDQNKAAWMKQAWDTIAAQYPNATDAATRAAIFEQMVKGAGANPSTSSALQVPAGSPAPTTRLDELKALALQFKLRPGTRDYALFIQSDGKKLPAGAVVTGDAAKAQGLDPTGSYQQDENGEWKVIVKPQEGGGTFSGTGMDAQDSNIILRGQTDPEYRKTPEYAMAWNRQYQQPKLITSQDPNDPSRTVSQAVIIPAPAGLLGPVGATASAPPAQPTGAPTSPVGGPQAPAIPQAFPIPGTGQQKPLTGEQSVSAGFLDRMRNSSGVIDKVSAAGTDALQAVLSTVPVAGNFLINSQRQQLEQAERDFVNAILRRESGAAISESEFENARQQYFPQPGDGPDVLRQKATNRNLAIRAMERNAGPAYPGQAAAAAPQQQPSGAPAVPANLSGRKLSWSASRRQFRDDQTGEVFNPDGTRPAP